MGDGSGCLHHMSIVSVGSTVSHTPSVLGFMPFGRFGRVGELGDDSQPVF